MINELKKINEKYSISLDDIQQYLDEIYKQYDDKFFNNKRNCGLSKTQQFGDKTLHINILYKTIYLLDNTTNKIVFSFRCDCHTSTNFILETKDKMFYYNRSKLNFIYFFLSPFLYVFYTILSLFTKVNYETNILEKIYHYEFNTKVGNLKHGYNNSFFDWKDKVLI